MATITLYKKLDKVHQRVIIPQFFVENYGEYYKMNIYKSRVELIPITEEEFKENRRKERGRGKYVRE